MSSEEMQLRRLVVCASGLVYWGGVLIQARRVRRQIGRSPNLRPRGFREKALWAGWLAVIAVWIGQPLVLRVAGSVPGLALLAGLLHPVGLVLGLVLVLLGYAGTLWSYAAMGNTWRIGVNAEEKTNLVDGGPYRWVRHPIYALQIVMLAGTALLLPTPLSFAILAVHLFCVLVKAGNEEDYLTRIHGKTYQAYLSRTGGLVPRLIGKTKSPKTSPSRDIDS